MQQRLENLVRNEEQLWPDCGGPSKYFSPTPRRPRRQNHPNLFLLGFRPKLRTLAYFQKTFPSRVPPPNSQGGPRVPGGSQGSGRFFLKTDSHFFEYLARGPRPGHGAARGPGPPWAGALGVQGRAARNLARYRSMRVLPTSELWEAGERAGSTCAIDVELRRRSPNVGGWARP